MTADADNNRYVLLGDSISDICGIESSGGKLIGIKPSSYAVIALPQKEHIGHTVTAEQLISEVNRGIVAHENIVVPVIRRKETHRQKDVGRRFLDAHPLLLHNRRQQGHRQLHPVLCLYERKIGIGADVKRERKDVHAVVGRLRPHVHQLVDAVDLLLDRCADRVGHHGRIGTGIGAGDLNDRRSDWRKE